MVSSYKLEYSYSLNRCYITPPFYVRSSSFLAQKEIYSLAETYLGDSIVFITGKADSVLNTNCAKRNTGNSYVKEIE